MSPVSSTTQTSVSSSWSAIGTQSTWLLRRSVQGRGYRDRQDALPDPKANAFAERFLRTVRSDCPTLMPGTGISDGIQVGPSIRQAGRADPRVRTHLVRRRSSFRIVRGLARVGAGIRYAIANERSILCDGDGWRPEDPGGTQHVRAVRFLTGIARSLVLGSGVSVESGL